MGKDNYNTGKQIGSLIAVAGTRLGQLTATATRLEKYQHIVRGLLEPSCQSHCWLAGFKDGKLHLQSDSSVWATRIRMQQRQLIDHLSREPGFSGIKTVKVSIRPRYRRPQLKHKAVPLSANAAEGLISCAKTTEDAALKAAIEKLASRSN